MKKRALFAAGLIAFGLILHISCSQDKDMYEITTNTNEHIAKPNTSNNNTKKIYQYVSLDEAREELQNILEGVHGLSKRGIVKNIKTSFTLTSNSTNNKNLTKKKKQNNPGNASVHVFNFENDEGFAIMPSTTGLPPILIMTDSGTLDTSQVIEDPNIVFILERLDNLCKAYDDSTFNNVDTTQTTLSKKYLKTHYKYTYYNPQGGNCKVHWHQHEPFNNYCFTKDNKRAVVGCTAIALGQFLSIYKCPNSYNGFVFDWNRILSGDTYGNDNAAILLRQLGNSENLNMNYGELSSGAKFANFPRTLKNMGFSNGGTISSYNENTVTNELRYGYNVIICGYAKEIKHTKKILGIKVKTYYTHEDGHAWLIHGGFNLTRSRAGQVPKEYNYFLFNIGWRDYESWNGYYSAGIFNVSEGPQYEEDYYQQSYVKSASEDDFKYNVEILTGIRK